MRPTAPPKPKPAISVAEKMPAYFRWLLNFLLAAVFALTLAEFFAPMNFHWPEALLILLATAATLATLARQLPLQNVLFAALFIALIGGGISALGVMSAIPFGPFIFSPEIGPEIFGTLPWTIPLIWIVVILNSRGVARLILRPWRKTKTYGFRVIGLTVILTLLFDLAFDPFASRVNHYWRWLPTNLPLTWQGAPLVNFLAWAFVTLLMLAFVTPALINKQLSKRSSPDFQPLCLWLGAILIFAIASAIHKLWPAVAVDAAIGIVAIIFAIRGARW